MHWPAWPLASCSRKPTHPPAPCISSTHGSCTVHCSNSPFSGLVFPGRPVSPSPFQVMNAGHRSSPHFNSEGCRCPSTTGHDRCMFQSLSDYLGYNGDNNCNRHVDLYPLPTPNLALRIQVQSSLHAVHIPVQQPLLRPVKD